MFTFALLVFAKIAADWFAGEWGKYSFGFENK
jgi:hypothetical protein